LEVDCIMFELSEFFSQIGYIGVGKLQDWGLSGHVFLVAVDVYVKRGMNPSRQNIFRLKPLLHL